MSEQSVTFTADELLEVKVAVSHQINWLRGLITEFDDPSGCQKESIKCLETVYEKISQARRQALEGGM